MKALEKAKLALRKHLLENKEQVQSDLQRMREISKGMDMSSYIENLSSSFSIENIEVSQDKNFDYSFDEIDTYGLIDELKSCYEWYPPDISLIESNKKDSDILSESFFLIHLVYGRSTKSSVFI